MQERGVELAIEPEEEPTTDSDVFYNTAMVTNRDITVACVAALQNRLEKELQICDALAASGVMGLRILEEVQGIEKLVFNDISSASTEKIQENLELNAPDRDDVTVSQGDANLLLTDSFRSLDYVDIDPFGSPVPYLDSAARALSHKAGIGVTATDLGPLYGSYPEVCRRRYASRPLKVSFGHEIGMRILLKEVVQAFSRYDHAFEPLMCWHQQHYTRVVGTSMESKKECNSQLASVGFLSFCRECRWRAYTSQEACPHCQNGTEKAGPLWTGQFANPGVAQDVERFLYEHGWEEATDIAEKIREEAAIDMPFYDSHELASAHDLRAPRRDDVIQELTRKGYRATRTHFSGQGFRTDAPFEDVIAAMEKT